MPKLLGAYKQPLHKYIEEIILLNYKTIFNVGWMHIDDSVGLALRLKSNRVLSFEINIAAEKALIEIANKNYI